MFDSVKTNLFTVHSIIEAFIYLFMVVGFVTCWILFQTQVMGNDPMAPLTQATGSHGRK